MRVRMSAADGHRSVGLRTCTQPPGVRRRAPDRSGALRGAGLVRRWAPSSTGAGLAVVAGGEVVARERVEVDEAQVALGEGRVVGEDAVRVPLRLRLLRGLDRDVPVTAEAGTRRDELADGDV